MTKPEVVEAIIKQFKTGEFRKEGEDVSSSE